MMEDVAFKKRVNDLVGSSHDDTENRIIAYALSLENRIIKLEEKLNTLTELHNRDVGYFRKAIEGMQEHLIKVGNDAIKLMRNQ